MCPNLLFLGELHLRLRSGEKILCLQMKTHCQREYLMEKVFEELRAMILRMGMWSILLGVQVRFRMAFKHINFAILKFDNFVFIER